MERHFVALICRFSRLIADRVGTRLRVEPLQPDRILLDPVGEFGNFVTSVCSQNTIDRFAILIDEFGTLLNGLEDEVAQDEFFEQWRALLQSEAVYRHITFIVVFPDTALARVPASARRLGELGHRVRVGLLTEAEGRELITAPVRTHLSYREEELVELQRATGGHPCYIHQVCSEIVWHIEAKQPDLPQVRQEVTSEMVQSAIATIAEFEDAHEHIRLSTTPATLLVLQGIAALQRDTVGVSDAALRRWLRRRGVPTPRLAITHALRERPDLLAARGGTLVLVVGLLKRWLLEQPTAGLGLEEVQQ